MDVTLFEKCIAYISSRYEVVLLEDLVKSQDLFASKGRYATLSFDDGYKDNIAYAAPILEKYHCKASFYVVTDSIENNTLTWGHLFNYLLENTSLTTVTLPFDFLPVSLRSGNLTNQPDRLAFIRKLSVYLKTISHENRRMVMEKVTSLITDVKMPELMMSWDDLRELKAAGHQVGSHSVSHPILGSMSNVDDIRDELSRSAKMLEQNLGYFPSIIAYPMGSYNATVKELSKEIGYQAGLTVNQDTYNPFSQDLFEIKRIELYNEPWWKTRLRITNTMERIKKLIRYK